MKVNALKWAVWSENEYRKPRVLAYFSRENGLPRTKKYGIIYV